jgi:hypothetical protein
MRLPRFTAVTSLPRPSVSYHAILPAAPDRVEGAASLTPQLSLPIYGNYCGPGHYDPTFTAPPVDEVDAACMEHDRCYIANGDFACHCDRQLIDSLPAAIVSTPHLGGKVAGAAALAFFSVIPCHCKKTICAWIPFVGRRCVTAPFVGHGGSCLI